MRTSIAMVFAVAFFSTSAGCQERALTPYEFGVLVREHGCGSAEQVAMRQPDPDLYLGVMYDLGLCRKQDDAQALSHYLRSAKRGNDESMYSVFLEIAKKGSKEGYKPGEAEQAQHWLIKAGENNNWRAAEVLALCYEKGCWDLPIDKEKTKHYKAVLEKYRPNPSFNTDSLKAALRLLLASRLIPR